MARTNRTASETIISVLKCDPRRDLSVFDIVYRSGLNLNTARATIGSLVAAGQVELVGREAPHAGRPVNVYRLAESA